MSALGFPSVWCLVFSTCTCSGSTHHPPFSITLVVVLFGLDRFQKPTLAVPEESEEMDPTHPPKSDFDSRVAPLSACSLASSSLYSHVRFTTTRSRRCRWKLVLRSSHCKA